MSGGGRKWSEMMEGVVWCDGGLSLMDEGWSSMVGVAGWMLLSMGVVRGWGVVIRRWALSSMGGWWSFVMGGSSFVMGGSLFVGGGSSFVVGDHRLRMGGCRSWWGVVVHEWGGHL